MLSILLLLVAVVVGELATPAAVERVDTGVMSAAKTLVVAVPLNQQCHWYWEPRTRLRLAVVVL